MKICLIQKYPPIQGGISRDAFLLSLRLVQAGHEVYVVTNSLEVEENYRYFDSSFYRDIGLDNKPKISSKLKIFSTETRNGHFVIPKVNPSVTKLSSLATSIVEKYNCDLILGFYLEPYGMAAYITSNYTGVPFGLMHGGRDIGQLLPCPDLYLAYKKLFEKADFIITTTTILGKLSFMNIDMKKIFYDKKTDYFKPFFSITKSCLDFNQYRQIILNNFSNTFVPELYKGLAKKEIKEIIPIIGTYSKSGRFKGIKELLQALSIVKKSGKAFYFIAVLQGEQEELEDILKQIKSLKLQNHVLILPFMPYWHIGHFVRSCTAVCFLETHFGISFHMPKIQNEVLASARCLIMSEEIAGKQIYKHKIKNAENCFVVNPHNINDLANILDNVISNKKMANQIAENGYRTLHLPFTIKEKVSIDRIDTIFSDIIHYLRLSEKNKVKHQLKKEISVAYDNLFIYKGTYFSNLVSDYCNNIDSSETFIDLLIGYGNYVIQTIPNEDTSSDFVTELIRYSHIKIRLKYNKVDPRFNPINNIILANEPITSDSVIKLLPDLTIENFKIDIPRAFRDKSIIGPIQTGNFNYVFQAAGNYHPSSKEFYISETVKEILDLCVNRVSVQEILDQFANKNNPSLLKEVILNSLKDLQKKLIIGLHTE